MKLYIVATPIGNLQDITLRALEVFSRVKVVLAEDTRQTKKIFARHGIQTKLVSYHQHSDEKKINEIVRLLEEYGEVALVTDAGTPGISDPGNELISTLSKKFGDSLEIQTVPGPSALTALASIADIPMNKFLFLGFPPHKKGRQKFFDEIATSRHPVILYESPYRIIKTLEALSERRAGAHVVVGKELTKLYEKIYRGSIEEVLEQIKKDGPRGEYTLIISL